MTPVHQLWVVGILEWWTAKSRNRGSPFRRRAGEMPLHRRYHKRVRRAQWLALFRFRRWPNEVRTNAAGYMIVVVESNALVLSHIGQGHQFHHLVVCSSCNDEFTWPFAVRQRVELHPAGPVLCDRCATERP